MNFKEIKRLKNIFNERYAKLNNQIDKIKYLEEYELAFNRNSLVSDSYVPYNHYYAWDYFKSEIENEIADLQKCYELKIELRRLDLTDEMYKEILYKIRDVVNSPDFYPKSEDCTEIGYKYTTTNCGLCNDDEFSTSKNAMWPNSFPDRKSMRYTKSHQKCPFDMREEFDSTGCFYECYIFKPHKYENEYHYDISRIKEMVEQRIQWAKDNLN